MERALLTAAFLGAVVLLWLLMLKGWRSRLRRQGDLPPPPVPPQVRGRPVLPATAGLYVGTTFADDWLDRVAVHDLAHRSAGWLRLDSHGLHVEREGLPDLHVPYALVADVSIGDALAGKVVGRNGMVLVDWHLGGRLLTSGFRADDPTVHRQVVDAVRAHLPAQGPPAADLRAAQPAPERLPSDARPHRTDPEAP